MERNHLKDKDVNGRIILKLMSQKLDGRTWTGFVYFWRGRSGWLLWTRYWTFRFHKPECTSLLAEKPADFQEDSAAKELYRIGPYRSITNQHCTLNSNSALLLETVRSETMVHDKLQCSFRAIISTWDTSYPIQLNNQQMQLYAFNFIPLLVSLYMFRVFYTPIIRSTIFNCIYSHRYKPYCKVQRQCYKIVW